MVKVIDSFESGNLDSAWGGDTGSVSVTTTKPWDGSYSTEWSGYGFITRDDVTISPGEVPFGAWFTTDYYFTGSDASFLWGVPHVRGFQYIDGYEARVNNNTGAISLYRWDSGNETNLQSSDNSGELSDDTYYELRVTEWTSAGDITAEYRDQNGNTINTVSAVDDTYGAGGVGIGHNETSDPPHWHDYVYKTLPPDPPSNVHFNDATTEDELTLDWDTVSDATGYYVYRAQSSGSTKSDYTQVADVTAPPYTDTGLEDGERYYYRVSSYS